VSPRARTHRSVKHKGEPGNVSLSCHTPGPGHRSQLMQSLNQGEIVSSGLLWVSASDQQQLHWPRKPNPSMSTVTVAHSGFHAIPSRNIPSSQCQARATGNTKKSCYSLRNGWRQARMHYPADNQFWSKVQINHLIFTMPADRVNEKFTRG